MGCCGGSVVCTGAGWNWDAVGSKGVAKLGCGSGCCTLPFVDLSANFALVDLAGALATGLTGAGLACSLASSFAAFCTLFVNVNLIFFIPEVKLSISLP